MSRTPAVALLSLGLLLTGGCAGDDTSRGAHEERPRGLARLDPSRPAPSVPTRSPATPRDRTEHRAVAPSPDDAPSGNALTIESVATPDDHLLGARALGQAWSVAADRAENGRPMSSCQRASLHDIGAMRTRVRELTAPDARAGQSVARFADRTSAWRAGQVLAAWGDACAEDLRRRGGALGTVRHRTWLSVVEVEGVDRPARMLRRALRTVRATFT